MGPDGGMDAAAGWMPVAIDVVASGAVAQRAALRFGEVLAWLERACRDHRRCALLPDARFRLR